jgi:hypothetical protein
MPSLPEKIRWYARIFGHRLDHAFGTKNVMPAMAESTGRSYAAPATAIFTAADPYHGC